MVEVTVKIEYEYAPEEEHTCKAIMQVTLPYDPDVRNCSIDRMIQSSRYQVAGDILHPFWGIPNTNGGGRNKYWVVSEDTWQELEQTTYETLFDIETVLRKVFEQNRKMKETKPKDREIKLVIGDGE